MNGLDPDGILWIRTLLKNLAAEGRTLLVSSHLMSEMSLTAEHLIVIGKGRLIADLPIVDLIASSPHRRRPASWCAHRSRTSCGGSSRQRAAPSPIGTGCWRSPA